MNVNLGDVATWIAALGGLVTGVFALVISRSARNETKRQADEMAEANRISREALTHAQEANRPTVSWAVKHNTGSTYIVQNVGSATAWDVKVRHEGLVESYSDPTADRLTPGEAIEFMATVHVQTRDNTVYVDWRAEADGEPHTWRHPLPTKSTP